MERFQRDRNRRSPAEPDTGSRRRRRAPVRVAGRRRHLERAAAARAAEQQLLDPVRPVGRRPPGRRLRPQQGRRRDRPPRLPLRRDRRHGGGLADGKAPGGSASTAVRQASSTAFWGAPRAPLSLAVSSDGGRSRPLRADIVTGVGHCLTNNSRDGLNRELSYPSVAQPPDAGPSISPAPTTARSSAISGSPRGSGRCE